VNIRRIESLYESLSPEKRARLWVEDYLHEGKAAAPIVAGLAPAERLMLAEHVGAVLALNGPLAIVILKNIEVLGRLWALAAWFASRLRAYPGFSVDEAPLPDPLRTCAKEISDALAQSSLVLAMAQECVRHVSTALDIEEPLRLPVREGLNAWSDSVQEFYSQAGKLIPGLRKLEPSAEQVSQFWEGILP
jgi:hypothetical protein